MLLASDTPWAGAAVFACATLRDQIIWRNAASARTLRGGKLLTAALQDSGWLRFCGPMLSRCRSSRARGFDGAAACLKHIRFLDKSWAGFADGRK